MPRIVPSQIVSAIEYTYPWAREAADGKRAFSDGLGPDHAPQIGTLLALLDALPDELLPLAPSDVLLVEAAKGAMRGALASWTGAPHSGAAARLAPSALFGGKHPVVALLLALHNCPDERADASVPELQFIPDLKARESLRTDVATAFRALGNGEYKASTVLAGSAVEALLLWRIKALDESLLAKAVASYDGGTPPKRLGARDPERWDLSELIAIAAETGAITVAMKMACDLCREFRNLIHPGRVLRSGADATKASALSALAAMQLLIE